ncbi:MAG TPA: hypothetical protein VMT86_13110 [Bryobacteraceae bacterium]|nr:hypothetical protein [Bryobacteraceae bacterium]
MSPTQLLTPAQQPALTLLCAGSTIAAARFAEFKRCYMPPR